MSDETGGTPGDPPQPPPGGLDGFMAELRDLWHTRPSRRPADGPLVGVAAGIGHRYDVDPVLIRVAFVVSAIFGGAGLALYAAAWLAMPGPDERTAEAPAAGYQAPRRLRSEWHLAIPVVILLVFFLSWAPSGYGMGSAGIMGTLLMLGGLYLLYRRRPVAPQPGAGEWPADPNGGTVHEAAPAAAPADAPGPPWGRADAGHPAWTPPGPPGPPPAPAPPRNPGRRPSPVTPVTLGAALLVAAAGVAAALVGVEWVTPARVAAAALGVVGAGLLAGAAVRKGHGLLIVAVPLAGFVVLASVAHQIEFRGEIGERMYTPVTAADLQDEYRIAVGTLDLDLTRLHLDADRTIEAHNGIGDVTVRVPHDMNVRTDCDVGIGTTDCGPDRVHEDDAPVLTVHAHNGIGEVVVLRD